MAQRRTFVICIAAWVGVVLLTMGGCSRGPSRVKPPKIDAQATAARAIELFDADGNGDLSQEELTACPSLAKSLARLDADSDGKLSAAEIAARINAWAEYGAGLASIRCTIERRGRPIVGATVAYVPEEFMADAVHPGSGVTADPDGRAIISMAAEHLPGPRYSGLQNGFYRVEVTMPDGEPVDDLNEGFEASGDQLNFHVVQLP